MFSILFSSCCGQRQRPHEPPTIPHERTPLIPTSDDNPTPQPRVIDQQKLKERLGTVVRSKEGKMVNVNAQFPFNLHNQDVQEHSSSRSSRNVSGGTYDSRAASPSPQRLQKSPSTTSFRPDFEDLAASQHLPSFGHRSAPILNVRLVKSGRPVTPRRGRPTHTHERNGRAQFSGSEIVPAASHSQFPETAGDDEERTPRAHPPPSVLGERLSTDVPADPSTPPCPEDFTIRDAGAVARSWGD